MSQTQFLRDLDDTMLGVFADVGLADAATYTPQGGGTAIPCTVMVDRDVQLYGDDQQPVAAPRVVITLHLDAIANPAFGAVVVLTQTSETFELESEIKRDESRSVWVVKNG